MTSEDRRPLTVLMAHPSGDLYGSDRVFLESVDSFAERGWKVHVAVPDGGPLLDELSARGAVVLRCATPVLRKSLANPAGLVRLAGQTVTGALRGLRLLRRCQPDVVYVSTITLPLWPLLSRLTRRPVVTHVHEAEAGASRWLRSALAIPLALATTIIANSEFTATVQTQALPALRGRPKIVYNGVPSPTSTTPARASMDGPLRVLYVGRLSHRKGVDVAIDAIAALRRRNVHAVLDIVGAVFPGYVAYEAELRRQVVDRNLGLQVTFHGFQASVWPFLERADVAVVPSRWDEPFGNTAVEALLAARPVVVSDTSGLREAAAGYASAQFVVPGDSADLADALERVHAGWTHFRQAAVLDAHAAAEKHGTEAYRRRVAEVVQCAAGR